MKLSASSFSVSSLLICSCINAFFSFSLSPLMAVPAVIIPKLKRR